MIGTEARKLGKEPSCISTTVNAIDISTLHKYYAEGQGLVLVIPVQYTNAPVGPLSHYAMREKEHN